MGDAFITRRGGLGGGLSESDAVLRVTAPTGSTFTAAKNGVTLSPKMWEQSASTFDTAIFAIPASSFDANAWTVSATDGTYSSSDTVVINGAYEFSIALNFHVPDGYQEVEYLQSSGTQYINVGLNPTSSLWGFEIDFTPLHAPSSSGHGVFGQKTADNNEWHLNTWYDTSNYNGTLIMKSSKYSARLANGIRCQMSMHNLEYINAEGTRRTVSNVSIGNLPLYIFCCNKNGTTSEFTSMKLYSFKLYDDTDTLVSELYPCYRISDSVAGLWDKEREMFLTNSGSGTFAVGADV